MVMPDNIVRSMYRHDLLVIFTTNTNTHMGYIYVPGYMFEILISYHQHTHTHVQNARWSAFTQSRAVVTVVSTKTLRSAIPGRYANMDTLCLYE